MSTQQAALSRGRTSLVLATLFLGSYVLGSAELLMVGLLNLVSTDLQISVPAAGELVTAYALGMSIGGPLLTALTIKLNKRVVLVGAVVLFALGNLVPVLVDSYGLFLAARALTGSLNGLFIAVAFVAGISIVPPERAGRAISTVFSGFAVSAATGAPLGTLLGQSLGWRNSFVAVVVLAVLTAVATTVLLPSLPSASGGGGAGNQVRYAFAPRVLAVLFLGFLAFASLYTALTYIVPYLERVTGISGALLSVFLLVYGVATAVGSFGGGRFADERSGRTMLIGSIGAAASLLVLFLGGAIAFVAAIALLSLGLFALGMVPAFQYRVISLAGPGGQLASSLPASAANAGIAVGSTIGGVAIVGLGDSGAVAVGLIIAAATIPVAWAAGLLKPPAVEEPAGQPAAVEPTAGTAS